MGSERVSITKVGELISFGSARVDCERCEEAGGWTGEHSGLHCPFGCGVRVVDAQAEDDARFRIEEGVRERVRRDRRAVTRARHTSSSDTEGGSE